MSGGEGGGVPAMEEAVVLEAAAAEEGLVRVESLSACEGGDVWATGGGREREGVG